MYSTNLSDMQCIMYTFDISDKGTEIRKLHHAFCWTNDLMLFGVYFQ